MSHEGWGWTFFLLVLIVGLADEGLQGITNRASWNSADTHIVVNKADGDKRARGPFWPKPSLIAFSPSSSWAYKTTGVVNPPPPPRTIFRPHTAGLPPPELWSRMRGISWETTRSYRGL